MVEKHYKNYLSGRAASTLPNVQFPGRPEMYSINLNIPMQQINTATQKSRLIRRVTNSDRKIKSNQFGETIRLVVLPPSNISGSRFLEVFSTNTDIAQNITSGVLTMVQAALGDLYDEWDAPVIDFILNATTIKDSVGTVTLTLVGLTKILSGLIVGKIRSILKLIYDCETEVLVDVLGWEAPSEAFKWISENPRLFQMATSIPPFPPGSRIANREHFALLVAHTMIWQLGCKVYGGFVRDWAIRGDPANDIDTYVPSGTNVRSMGARLATTLSPFGVRVNSERQNGKAWSVQLSLGTLKPLDVDLVDMDASSQSPGADCDSGNLCINTFGRLEKKSNKAGGQFIPLVQCLKHCMKKKFVFFYAVRENRDVARRRLHKYFSRGWTCVGMCAEGKDAAALQEFQGLVDPKYHHLVSIKEKYCKQWNKIS